MYCRKQGERFAKCFKSFTKSGVPRATHGTPRAMPCHVSLKTWHGVARLLEFWTWHGTPRATFFQNVAWHGTGIFFRARRGTRHAPRAPPSLCIFNKQNMLWKWSNMAHDKNYFPEKKPVFLLKIQKGSWEYSKIICERMKVITILI